MSCEPLDGGLSGGRETTRRFALAAADDRPDLDVLAAIGIELEHHPLPFVQLRHRLEYLLLSTSRLTPSDRR